MIDGRVLQTGTPAEVYRRPNSAPSPSSSATPTSCPARVSGSEVECEIGSVPSIGGGTGDVEVMLRPEELELNAETGVPVAVVSREYFGHDQLVTVRLPSGREVQVRTLSAHKFEPGDALGLRATGHAVVFPAA